MTGGREGPGEHAPKRRERRQALHAMIAERNIGLYDTHKCDFVLSDMSASKSES